HRQRRQPAAVRAGGHPRPRAIAVAHRRGAGPERVMRKLAAILLLSGAAYAAGEYKAHGFTLPGGSVKVDDDRYRLPQAWDDARRYYRSIYPPLKFPRRTLPNFAGVRAEHIENPGGGEWS